MKISEVILSNGTQLDFFEKLRKEVVRLADENPDFRYNTSDHVVLCSWNGPAIDGNKLAGPDCKGCIFGQALQNMGWDDEDEMNKTNSIRDLLTETELIKSCDESEIILELFSDTQNSQDSGYTWKVSTGNIRKTFI
jgi:hypothetical protein